MAHAVALHHRQLQAACFLLYPHLEVAGWIEEGHTPLTLLGEMNGVSL